uniref:Ethylene insensitive 3-like DNA-binding domain-containing protein n=1 Tax=Oryza punctata TaxID=4537 RepID=A0A0E0LIL0_ORYPU
MASNSNSKRSSSSSIDQQHAKRRRRAPGDELSQTLGVASNAVVGVNGVAPLMLSPVTMQVQLLCYVAMPMAVAAASSSPAAGGGVVPLAVALCRLYNGTLERMVREMAQECTPPLVTRDRKNGATPPPPPWWPTAKEPWWGTEVAAHLRGRPMATPVPFASPRRLVKAEKVAVLVAVVKHVAPDFGRLAAAAGRSRLTELESSIWESALRGERERYVVMMPSFILLPPPPPQHVHSAESAAAHADPEPESADQSVVDFSVSGEDAAARGSGSEDTATTGPELEQLVGNVNGATAAAHAVEEEGQKPEDTPGPPLLEEHGGEDHDHHLYLHGDFSGEVSGAAAADVAPPEDVDWFDYDEVLRGLDELEIPSFFGGYYV